MLVDHWNRFFAKLAHKAVLYLVQDLKTVRRIVFGNALRYLILNFEHGRPRLRDFLVRHLLIETILHIVQHFYN